MSVYNSVSLPANTAIAYHSTQDTDIGWNRIYEKALLSYIGLNLLCSFPELWDPASGGVEKGEYLYSGLYQLILLNAVESGSLADVASYPHQQFFGMSKDQLLQLRSIRRCISGCTMTARRRFPSALDVLFSLEGRRYRPHAPDVETVRRILFGLGLPMEVILEIMKYAEYTPQRGLYVANDPLCWENRDELAKYLTCCWLLLVRCDMMAKEMKIEIDWTSAVEHCLARLLTCPGGKRWYDFDPWEGKYQFI